MDDDVPVIEGRLHGGEGFRVAAAEEVDHRAVPEPKACAQLDVADAGERNGRDIGEPKRELAPGRMPDRDVRLHERSGCGDVSEHLLPPPGAAAVLDIRGAPP